MKHKIAAGLGLALSLTTGICSAEFLGSTQEVNTQIPFALSLSNLSSEPGKYYTAVCHVINTHATKKLSLNVSLANGTYSPVVYDGQGVKKDATGKGFTVLLSPNDDDKVLIIQKIHAASTAGEECPTEMVAGDPIMMDEVKPVVHHPIYGFWYFFPYTVNEPTGNKIVDTSKTPPMVSKKVCHPVMQSDILTFSAIANNSKEMGAGYRISCDLNRDFLASAIAADASAAASKAAAQAAADASAPVVVDAPAAPVADSATPVTDVPAASADATPAAQ